MYGYSKCDWLQVILTEDPDEILISSKTKNFQNVKMTFSSQMSDSSLSEFIEDIINIIIGLVHVETPLALSQPY